MAKAKTIIVEQIGSPIRRDKSQRATLIGLGLNKMNKKRELIDTPDVRGMIRAWEEAPLLDDLAVTSGYRASLLNLGLVGVRYHRLDEYVHARGNDLATSLGISLEALEYICRCLLDEMRVRSALSREMLRYHPAHPSCPAHVRAAEWERHNPPCPGGGH